MFRFGAFELDVRTGELRKRGSRVRIQDQPLKVLLVLLERPGELISRDELRESLWAQDTFVDFDHGLNIAINRLRQVLIDSAERPRYIETLPRRGYRFIAQVQAEVEAEEPAVAPPVQAASQPRANRQSRYVIVGLIGLVLFLAAVAGSLLSTKASRARARAIAVPLTAYAGAEVCPALSPDGDRVAFAWNGEKQENFDIYVKQIGSGAPLRLTTDPAMDMSPAWSPDGKAIAFLRRLAPESAGLFLIPSLGGPARRVAEIGTPDFEFYQACGSLAWTPDGKWILVAGKTQPQSAAGIIAIGVDTAERRMLTSPLPPWSGDFSIGLSPNGREVAFARFASPLHSELYLLPISADLRPEGDARQLTFYNRRVSTPAWSPDGRTILIARVEAGGGQRLWSIARSGGGAEPLAGPGDNASALTVSGQAGRLVYSRQVNDTDIWRAGIPAAGGTAPAGVAPFIASTRNESTPHFSPDGSRIAFQSDRSGDSEIWICDRDGSNPRQLTAVNGFIAGFPRWSPDGRRIVFHSRVAGYAKIYTMDAEGGKPTPLTAGPGEDYAPSWSHDGNWIYFTSRRTGPRPEIWRIPARGGQAVQWTDRGGYAPLESPDGGWLFYSKSGERGLWKRPVSGGQEEFVLDGLAEPSAYAVTKTGVYYIGLAEGGSGRLEFLRFSTRQKALVAPVRNVGLGLAVSPDQREVLYTQVAQGGSDLMLVERFQF